MDETIDFNSGDEYADKEKSEKIKIEFLDETNQFNLKDNYSEKRKLIKIFYLKIQII